MEVEAGGRSDCSRMAQVSVLSFGLVLILILCGAIPRSAEGRTEFKACDTATNFKPKQDNLFCPASSLWGGLRVNSTRLPKLGANADAYNTQLALTDVLSVSPRARYCSKVKRRSFLIIRIERDLGCPTIRRLASITMKSKVGGYFQNRRFYCRWGSGGYPGKQINGRIFYFGFCDNKQTGQASGFFARWRA